MDANTSKPGRKTTEFWLGAAGTVVGALMVKEGYAAGQVLAALAPALTYVFGRNVFKWLGIYQGGIKRGEEIRNTAKDGEEDPDADDGSEGP